VVHIRTLSAENESGIADFMQANYIQTGQGVTRVMLKSLCLDSDAHQEERDRHVERFEHQPRS
jgi:hypothetical protein